MRFNIATTILASRVFSATSAVIEEQVETNPDTGAVVSGGGFRLKEGSMTSLHAEYQKQKKKTLMHRQKKKRQLQRSAGIAMTATKVKPLVNNGQQRPYRTNVECDPNTPDQGILACSGDNNTNNNDKNFYYCMESSRSSLGGICSKRNVVGATIRDAAGSTNSINGVLRNPPSARKHSPQRRHLQEGRCPTEEACATNSFCNYDFESEGECEICPCGDPSFSCYSIGLPFEGVGECISECNPGVPNGEVCQEYKGGCYFDGIAGTGTNLCTFYYDFGPCTGYVTQLVAYENYESIGQRVSTTLVYEPYSQNVTVAYSPPSEESTERSCEIVFDGTLCDACELNDPDSSCYDFDCTNVPRGTAGNDCYMPISPAVANYCSGIPTECNICSDGEYLQFPNSTTFVPGVGEYACSDIYSNGFAGNFGSQDSNGCLAASIIAGPVCCGSGVVPTDPPAPMGCNICRSIEGGYLYNEDVIVSIPGGNEEYTCSEIYEAGISGDFLDDGPDGTCAAISDAIGSTCCSSGGDVGPIVTESPSSVSSEVEDACYVCPGNGDVGNPTVTVPGTGDPELTCSEIQALGRQGLIPSDQCPAAQAGVPLVCGCLEPPSEVVPSEVPSGAPTNAPIQMTEVPVIAPSEAPVDVAPSIMPIEATDDPSPAPVDLTMPPGETDAPGEDPPCIVCPGDTNVLNPNLEVPGTGCLTCAELQDLGRQALIPSFSCPNVQAAVPLICMCAEVTAAPSNAPDIVEMPTDAPVAPPTNAPVQQETDQPVAPTDPPTEEPDSGACSFHDGVVSWIAICSLMMSLTIYGTAV